MKRFRIRHILFAIMPVALCIAIAASAYAGLKPEADGQTCMSDCSQCHVLSNKEATEVLKRVNPEIDVIGVREAPVSGLWEVAFRARGKKSIAYVDISGKHIMTGSIIYARTGQNVTKSRIYDINKVDVSAIPTEDALIFGNPQALYRVIVFVDPDNENSLRLHREMRKIVEERDDVVFLIKLYPIIKINPAAYAKSKAIVCDKSVRLLERAYEGRTLPAAGCDSNAVDENIELAERMGIESTPTYILPDGGIDSGPRRLASCLIRFSRQGRSSCPLTEALSMAPESAMQQEWRTLRTAHSSSTSRAFHQDVHPRLEHINPYEVSSWDTIGSV